MLPLVVHQNRSPEHPLHPLHPLHKLTDRDGPPRCPSPLHPLQKFKDGDRRRHIYWGGGARVLPLVVHQNRAPHLTPLRPETVGFVSVRFR